MKTAITAASGKLGSEIVKEAVREFGRDNVIAIARNTEKAGNLGVEVRKGDYNSFEEYVRSLEGVEVVLLISGMDTPDKRIIQHRNVIRAASQNKVRKIIYSSISGREGKCAFDDIILSNRQTERDIMDSGMEWSVGRNGIYLEPVMEALPRYFEEGKIVNCAGDGRCPYTTRDELAKAYIEMIRNDSLNGKIYNLIGEAVTQQELTDAINEVYGSNLEFESVSVKEYKKDRTRVFGAFLGKIIAGISEGIRNGAFDLPSDFRAVTGREHRKAMEYIRETRNV